MFGLIQFSKSIPILLIWLVKQSQSIVLTATGAVDPT